MSRMATPRTKGNRLCRARGRAAVVAEGIESRATADFLVSMGCEEGQGYFVGRPMPAETIEKQFLTAELEAVSAA